MDDNQLRAYLGDEETFVWIRTLLRFLQSVFGEAVGHAEAVAIMCVLLRVRILLKDGSVFNDNEDLNRGIWTVDAALMAALMCPDPSQSVLWWKGEYGTFPKETEEFQELERRVLERIEGSPLVAGCGPS